LYFFIAHRHHVRNLFYKKLKVEIRVILVDIIVNLERTTKKKNINVCLFSGTMREEGRSDYCVYFNNFESEEVDTKDGRVFFQFSY